jgi:hypothetical protein
MTKVFFGGSRGLSKLNADLIARTDKIIENEYRILVGDANGADKVMQHYLSDNNYEHVHVYCMEDTCRNNIGGWKTIHICTDRKTKDFNFFSTKDLRMSEDADYGFMLWDGKSKGTLNNILNLCERNKKALVYFTPQKSFFTIANFGDISDLLENCDHDALQLFEKGINLITRLNQQQLGFDGHDSGKNIPI